MALRKIPINEYGQLLYRLDCLSFSDEKRGKLEKTLKQSYSQYQELLGKLEEVIKIYEATSKEIKARHPLKKSDRVPVEEYQLVD